MVLSLVLLYLDIPRVLWYYYYSWYYPLYFDIPLVLWYYSWYVLSLVLLYLNNKYSSGTLVLSLVLGSYLCSVYTGHWVLKFSTKNCEHFEEYQSLYSISKLCDFVSRLGVFLKGCVHIYIYTVYNIHIIYVYVNCIVVRGIVAGLDIRSMRH